MMDYQQLQSQLRRPNQNHNEIRIIDDDESFKEVQLKDSSDNQLQLSSDDLDYLSSLDKKLDGRNLKVKVQPVNQQQSHYISPSNNEYHSHDGVNINISSFGNDGAGMRTPQIHKYNLFQPNGSMFQQKQLRWNKKDLIYEKLSATHKPQYIEVARLLQEIEEKKKCTFKPEVNDQSRRYEDMQKLFEKLHNDRTHMDGVKVKAEKIKLRLETLGCTFTPQRISVKNSQQESNKHLDKKLYERLYKDHEQIVKKKIRIRYEQEVKMNADLTFQPQLFTSYSSRNCNNSSEHKDKFEKLYQDSKVRDEKIRKKKEEKENIIQSMKIGRRSNSVQEKSISEQPRYITLYENSKILSSKKKLLEKKIFQERGITFTPQSYRQLSKSITSMKECQQDKKSATVRVKQKSKINQGNSKLPPKPR